MPRFDAHTPHIARMYNYWLGGKDNFEADRRAAEAAIAANPTILPGVHANRRFLGRTVRYMAEQGVTQFLDIGTGIPAPDNTHEVAGSVTRDYRVVYVDNDPLVLSHAKALMKASRGSGRIAYIDADARDTGRILAEAARTLDFTRPVGVMLIAILHCIPDEDYPAGIVAALLDAVPAGSFLALSHPAIDQVPEAGRRGQATLTQSLGMTVTYRTREQVTQFFTGLEFVDDGVVPIQDWRPDTLRDVNSPPTGMWGAVARKDASRN